MEFHKRWMPFYKHYKEVPGPDNFIQSEPPALSSTRRVMMRGIAVIDFDLVKFLGLRQELSKEIVSERDRNGKPVTAPIRVSIGSSRNIAL